MDYDKPEVVSDNPDLTFKNIDHETYRTYIFPNGEVTINRPLWLNVSASGGHRLLDSEGVSHYIPSGWIHFFWEVDDKVHFRF